MPRKKESWTIVIRRDDEDPVELEFEDEAAARRRFSRLKKSEDWMVLYSHGSRRGWVRRDVHELAQYRLFWGKPGECARMSRHATLKGAESAFYRRKKEGADSLAIYKAHVCLKEVLTSEQKLAVQTPYVE